MHVSSGGTLSLLACCICRTANHGSGYVFFHQLDCLVQLLSEGFCLVLMYFVLSWLIFVYWRSALYWCRKERKWIKGESGSFGELGRVKGGEPIAGMYLLYDTRVYFKWRKHKKKTKIRRSHNFVYPLFYILFQSRGLY